MADNTLHLQLIFISFLYFWMLYILSAPFQGMLKATIIYAAVKNYFLRVSLLRLILLEYYHILVCEEIAELCYFVWLFC